MKKEFMKMAGIKTEKEFYAKFKTESDFFEAFPQAVKMVQQYMHGGQLSGAPHDGQPTAAEFFSYGPPTPNFPRLFQYGGPMGIDHMDQIPSWAVDPRIAGSIAGSGYVPRRGDERFGIDHIPPRPVVPRSITGPVREAGIPMEGYAGYTGMRRGGSIPYYQYAGQSPDAAAENLMEHGFGPVRNATIPMEAAAAGIPEITRNAPTFGQAFNAARKAGLKVFPWGNSTYSTETAEEKAARLKGSPKKTIPKSLPNSPNSKKLISQVTDDRGLTSAEYIKDGRAGGYDYMTPDEFQGVFGEPPASVTFRNNATRPGMNIDPSMFLPPDPYSYTADNLTLNELASMQQPEQRRHVVVNSGNTPSRTVTNVPRQLPRSPNQPLVPVDPRAAVVLPSNMPGVRSHQALQKFMASLPPNDYYQTRVPQEDPYMDYYKRRDPRTGQVYDMGGENDYLPMAQIGEETGPEWSNMATYAGAGALGAGLATGGGRYVMRAAAPIVSAVVPEPYGDFSKLNAMKKNLRGAPSLTAEEKLLNETVKNHPGFSALSKTEQAVLLKNPQYMDAALKAMDRTGQNVFKYAKTPKVERVRERFGSADYKGAAKGKIGRGIAGGAAGVAAAYLIQKYLGSGESEPSVPQYDPSTGAWGTTAPLYQEGGDTAPMNSNYDSVRGKRRGDFLDFIRNRNVAPPQHMNPYEQYAQDGTETGFIGPVDPFIGPPSPAAPAMGVSQGIGSASNIGPTAGIGSAQTVGSAVGRASAQPASGVGTQGATAMARPAQQQQAAQGSGSGSGDCNCNKPGEGNSNVNCPQGQRYNSQTKKCEDERKPFGQALAGVLTGGMNWMASRNNLKRAQAQERMAQENFGPMSNPIANFNIQGGYGVNNDQFQQANMNAGAMSPGPQYSAYGGEMYLSDQEIDYIKRNGGSVEYLD